MTASTQDTLHAYHLSLQSCKVELTDGVRPQVLICEIRLRKVVTKCERWTTP